MNTYRTHLLFLAVLAILVSPALHADPVTWYLNGVTFSDGSRAVGSFVYDNLTGLYTSINITTTPGTAATPLSKQVTDVHFTSQGLTPHPTLVNFWTDANPVAGVTGMLQLGFTNSLSAGGGTIQLDLGSYESVCPNTVCQAALVGTTISVTAGSVSAAPTFGPRTWYLDDVTFDDGGHATGSFVFDSVSNTYSNVDITVTSGTTFTSAYHYGVPGAPPSPTGFANAVRAFSTLPAQKGDRIFNGTFAAPLTNNGGVVSFNSSAQEASCDSSDCIGNGVTAVRLITIGSVTTVRPAGYTSVLSQILDGGGWQTNLTITNRSKSAQAYTVSFWQDNGTPWSIPGIGSSVAVQVPGNGVKVLNSSGTSSGVVQGWAKVEGYEAYSAMAIFMVRGDQENQQASVGGDPTHSNSFTMPFDETSQALVGLALTNPSATQAQTALVVAYDETGKVIVNDFSIVLQPQQHMAFVLDQQFPALAGQRGKVRVFGIPTGNSQLPFLGLNGLGVRQLPDGSFTNLQVTYD